MPPKKETIKQLTEEAKSVPLKEDPIGIVLNAGKAAFAFLQTSLREYSLYVLKVNLISTVVGVLLLVILGIAVFAVLGAALLSPSALPQLLTSISVSLLVALGILFLLLILLSTFIQQAIYAALFAGTKVIMEKKPTPSILGLAKDYFVPASKYTLVMGLLFLIIFAIPFPALLLPSPANVLIFFGLFILLGLVALVLFFLIQFGFWELIINKRGVLESLKVSYALVKQNLFAVIIFDIVLFITAFAIGSVFYVISYVLQLIFMALILLVPVIGITALVVVTIVLGLIQTVLIHLLIFPFTYAFWKSLTTG